MIVVAQENKLKIRNSHSNQLTAAMGTTRAVYEVLLWQAGGNITDLSGISTLLYSSSMNKVIPFGSKETAYKTNAIAENLNLKVSFVKRVKADIFRSPDTSTTFLATILKGNLDVLRRGIDGLINFSSSTLSVRFQSSSSARRLLKCAFS